MARKKDTTKKKAEEKPLIINEIVVQAPQRRVYDVGDWRTALRSADTGRVKQLYDLFDDILIDGVLSDAIEKRIDAVINSELTFQDKEGKEVEKMTALIDTSDFEILLREIIKSKFFGRSAVAMDFHDGFQVFPIAPKYIDLKNKTILRQDTDDTGFPYEGDAGLLVLGRPLDYGLLLKAVPYVIYKRGGFGDYSQWLELFGMPQRIGKYNTYDPESRKLLEQAFKMAGSAPYIIVPKDTEIETKESIGGNGSSYNEFRKACNEEVLITILGQTLTTTQGERGARSLGEVHKDVEEAKNKADIRFVQRVLNERVLPVLTSQDSTIEGGKFIFPKSAEPLSVADVVQLSDIMSIPQSFLHDKYSIPVPKEGEPIARRQSREIIVDEPDSNKTAKKPKETEIIENSDKSFFRRLRDFFGAAPHDDGADLGW